MRCIAAYGKSGVNKKGRTMLITLNGEPRELAEGTTLATLVASLGGDPRGIAIERNLEIVPKSEHGSVTLEAGDRLEVVQFVGGG